MKGNKKTGDTTKKFEKMATGEGGEKYVLKLYIAGNTSRSAEAIVNLRRICETRLKGRYQLEVVDIYQQPGLAKGEQIIAVPTLIKSLPLPLKRIIGDLSKTDRVILGLDLRKTDQDPEAGSPSVKPREDHSSEEAGLPSVKHREDLSSEEAGLPSEAGSESTE